MSEWHWVSINPVWAVCVCVCATYSECPLGLELADCSQAVTRHWLRHLYTHHRHIDSIHPSHSKTHSEKLWVPSNDFSFTLKALLFRSLPFCYTWNWICFQEVFPYRTLYQDAFRPVKASMISLAAPCIQATASLLFFCLQCWMISGYERWTGF